MGRLSFSRGFSHAAMIASYACCRPRVFLNSSRVITGWIGPDLAPSTSMNPTTCAFPHTLQRLGELRANDGVDAQAAMRRPETKNRAYGIDGDGRP